MALLTRAALAALLVAAPGCDPIPAPSEPVATDWQLQLHSVLLAGAESATLLLTRVRPTATGGTLLEPVPDATVRLSGGGVAAELRASASAAPCGGGVSDPAPAPSLAPGCYTGRVPGGIRAGEAYELRVDLPDGNLIRGRTVVPPVPSLLSPTAGAHVEVPRRYGDPLGEPLRLEWAAPAAARIEAAVRPLSECRAAVASDREFAVASVELTGPQPERLWVTGVVCPGADAPTGEHPAELVLTAFDSTYARYAREALDPNQLPRDRAAAGITGAVGVFASAAQARKPVSLVVR